MFQNKNLKHHLIYNLNCHVSYKKYILDIILLKMSSQSKINYTVQQILLFNWVTSL